MSGATRLVAWAVVGVVLVLVASCSGGSDADPAAETSRTTTSPSTVTGPTEEATQKDPDPHLVGRFTVVKTTTKTPKVGFQGEVGDKVHRVWTVKAACRHGSCGGSIRSANPETKGRSLRTRFEWSRGMLRFAFKQTGFRCGKGFGTYKVTSAYKVKPVKVADDGTVILLEGTSTDTYERESRRAKCYEGVITYDIGARLS